MSSLYTGSATVLLEFVRDKAPLTTALFASKAVPETQKKAAYALLLGTLRYKSVLDEVIEVSNLMKLDRKMNRALVLVMLYDLLFSPSQTVQGGGAVKKLIMAHSNQLKTALVRIKIQRGAASDEELLPQEIRFTSQLPRYVRVNTLRTTVDSVHAVFKSEGFQFVKDKKFDHRHVSWKAGEDAKKYYLDADIPQLLVFSPGTDFHDHDLLLSGKVILQDKASCMPAAALNPNPTLAALQDNNQHMHILDACAAPGNKTTHVLAIAMEHLRKNMKTPASGNTKQTNAKQTFDSFSSSTAATSSTTPSKLHHHSHNNNKSTRMPSLADDDENDVAILRKDAASRATGQQVSFLLGGAVKGEKPQATVEAFEVDPTRFQLLRRMMTRALPTPFKVEKGEPQPHTSNDDSDIPACPPARVLLNNRSFLDVDPTKAPYNSVSAILLDPTCSGSGMLHRIEQFYKHRVETKDATAEGAGPLSNANKKILARSEGLHTRVLPAGSEKKEVMENVAQLSQFQITILNHALSFPNLQLICYSTCSIHASEDEYVVQQVLEQNPAFELDRSAIPSWFRRGEVGDTTLSKAQVKCCIRSNGAEDGMNGFFVSKFVRKANYTPAAAAAVAAKKAATTNVSLKSVLQQQPQPSSKKRSREVEEEEQEEDDEAEEDDDNDEADDNAMIDGNSAVGKQTKRNKKKREKAKLKKKMKLAQSAAASAQ